MFGDLKGTQRPLWRDVSRHQGIVDFFVMSLGVVRGVTIRAGISWGYQDAWFPANWSGSKENMLYRNSYHVIYPGQNVVRQADNWFNINPEIDTIPRVIDLEKDTGVSAKQVADDVWEMSEVVLQRDGVRPWIYSRYMLVNYWLASWTPDMLNAHKWFLAQYRTDRTVEHAGPPTLPYGVHPENVLLHQTADKIPGFAGECESAAIDYDRWTLGNEIQLEDYITAEYGGTPPDPIPQPPDGYDPKPIHFEELTGDYKITVDINWDKI